MISFRPAPLFTALFASLLAISLSTGLGGCASSVPAPLLLTLPAAALRGDAPASAATPAEPLTSATAPLLVLRRVELPEYLVSRRVRYRSDAATLGEWPNTYWAERIEIGVGREFAAALRQQLPGWAVCDANCGDAAPRRTLEVELLSMDFLRGTQTLRARARLTVRGSGSGNGNGNGAPAVAPRAPSNELSYDLPAGADTPQAHAQAITTLLQQVARAAALRLLAAQP